MKLRLICCSISFEILIGLVLAIRDPYATLGLTRKASSREIRSAYKNLAKEWHPDKSNDPKANAKFMEIAQAHEILTDPVRKERYDKFGTFDEPTNDINAHANKFYAFDEFFSFAYGGFDSGNSFFQKHRISYRIFSRALMDRSYSMPLLIFAYSGYCQLCFRLESVWQSVVQDIEPLGYEIGTVNAITDGNLLEKLRISKLPSVVAVVEGRVIHYRETMQHLVPKSLISFARSVIPSSFLTRITNHDGLKRFIDQWKTANKISVLIFAAKEVPRMRYLLLAMKYFHFARFAYTYLDEQSSEIADMREALDIKYSSHDVILIFNDYPQNGPVVRFSVETSQVSLESIRSLIESNKFLVLPRISSQAYLDDLCPVSTRASQKFCILLATMDSSYDAIFVKTLRDSVFKMQSNSKLKNMHFTYLYINKQEEFIKPFFETLVKVDSSFKSNKRNIFVIWRLEYSRARFMWLKDIWEEGGSKMNHFALQEKLNEITRGVIRLENIVQLKELVDEHRPSLFTRLSRAVLRMSEAALFHLTKEEALPVVSAIATFIFILLVGYGLNYFNRNDKFHQRSKPKRHYPGNSEDQWHPEDPHINSKPKKNHQQRIMRDMQPFIHELRAETYFGMIRLLKPGCRSIIVLVDADSIDKLLPQFATYLWPFRNNKTFSFGYLMMEKNLGWFRKLLEHTLPLESGCDPSNENHKSLSSRLNNINPTKTLGTVLVLCGWKLYFNMYHPMHTSGKRKNFLGFDEDADLASSDESDNVQVDNQFLRNGYQLKIEDVLNGLPNWLDRLFEGSVRRYYIPEWPDNLK